ncbi:citrate synthase [Lapillicoccus jejuensis]|uniref:citrate synthase (unknown stereospecificity) n=1 Tax=Lapillicoccus jejuensis TaxID=402171 RepID=A0A542E1R5_9MICO|nr:citrate synthase [Lapillicoccus jejuensis]TQJ09278.1 citrate synthase [Lapillicoccus jejuensis]
MTAPAARASVTAEQAAELLGVRLQTVYAYVSRGLLARDVRRDAGGRRVSGFDREEVLRLAGARTRHRSGSLDVFVETDVSTLDPRGRLAFRGVPLDALLGPPARRVEDVAELLWSEDGRLDAGAGWRLDDGWRAVARRVAQALPDGVTDADRLRAAVLALAGADPDRADLGREHVAAVGRAALLAGVAALPLRGEPVEDGDLERRLWPRLTARPATEEGLEALRTALVALLDHELAASTMAVRVAAGTGADPWLLLSTGLAALGGPRHGGASREVTRLLARCDAGGGVDAAVAAAVASYGSGVPGFGHLVYTDADPRAEALLDRVARLDPDGWPVVERLLLRVARDPGLSPNVDLGLAALSRACGFVDGAGETVFALARQVGWLAHGLEEGPHGLRFRGRAAPSA